MLHPESRDPELAKGRVVTGVPGEPGFGSLGWLWDRLRCRYA
jgi:hypothetical protein